MQFRILIFSIGVLAIAISSPARSQESTQVMLAAGLQHLETARTTRTDTGYAAAEERFTAFLAAEPMHARALVHRGEARIMRGALLIATSLPNALELFQSGMVDMDRAVSIAPEDLTVRVTRGLSYVEFPPYYNKQPVARKDLEAAVAHPQFSRLPEPLRDRVARTLQREARRP